MSAPPLPLDRETGAVLTLGHEEHDIHQGNSFAFHFQSSAPLPTAVNEETAIGFTTPSAAQSAKRIHLTVSALANDESTFEIREAPTVVVAQGTQVTPLNRNRSSINTSQLRDHIAVPVANSITTYNVAQAAAANLAAAGAVLHSESLAVGGGAPFASAENVAVRGEKEWELSPATDYVIILTNLTVNNTLHQITLNWSESEPANYVS